MAWFNPRGAKSLGKVVHARVPSGFWVRQNPKSDSRTLRNHNNPGQTMPRSDRLFWFAWRYFPFPINQNYYFWSFESIFCGQYRYFARREATRWFIQGSKGWRLGRAVPFLFERRGRWRFLYRTCPLGSTTGARDPRHESDPKARFCEMYCLDLHIKFGRDFFRVYFSTIDSLGSYNKEEVFTCKLYTNLISFFELDFFLEYGHFWSAKFSRVTSERFLGKIGDCV